jgi:esterase/lipase superfamily enzyme
MNREYHKGFSRQLHRDMEMLVFGHAGAPILVFPSSMGRFFEYEDAGMVAALAPGIEAGQIQLFCVDSVDLESWYNHYAHPRDKVARHVQYDNFLVHEVAPYIRSRNPAPMLTVTGCSFGGYHAMNLALRHPDIVTHCVSMSGRYNIKSYLDGYYDDNCYFNCPVDFLPNLNDEWFLGHYRSMKIVLATGQNDICLEDNRQFAALLDVKSIPHWLDVWGSGCDHHWFWWKQMAQKYFL